MHPSRFVYDRWWLRRSKVALILQQCSQNICRGGKGSPEQSDGIFNFIRRKDVFAVLPTVLGQSLVVQLAVERAFLRLFCIYAKRGVLGGTFVSLYQSVCVNSHGITFRCGCFRFLQTKQLTIWNVTKSVSRNWRVTRVSVTLPKYFASQQLVLRVRPTYNTKVSSYNSVFQDSNYYRAAWYTVDFNFATD